MVSISAQNTTAPNGPVSPPMCGKREILASETWRKWCSTSRSMTLQAFRHYGYAKTTVADLANAIGFSKAYIYKFFQSKQAIGDAIGIDCVTSILEAAKSDVDRASTATDKLQRLFETVTAKCLELLFEDKKLYDIVTWAIAENWNVAVIYKPERKNIGSVSRNSIAVSKPSISPARNFSKSIQKLGG